MPYIGQGLSEGTRQLYTYTATANQSVFSASYTPGKVDVFQNGVLLFPNDYTATDGATITLSTSASLNDEISIIAQDVFSVLGNVSNTYLQAQGYDTGDVSNNYLNTTLSTKVDETHTGDVTIAGQITQTNTDSTNLWSDINSGVYPYTPMDHELTIRNDALDTANSAASIFFRAGQTTAGLQVNSARIAAIREAAFDTSLAFSTRASSSGHTEKMRITSDGNVGINASSPSHQLHLKETGSSGTGIFLEASNETTGYEIARTGASGFLDLKGTQNSFSGFTFSTTDGSGTTSARVQINNSGHMTKADQPLFVGRLDAVTTTASNYVIGVSQIYNRSMSFDSSTDRITVPTSGYYMIHAQQLYQSSGGIYMEVRVNGAAKFYGYGNMGTTHRDLIATGIWYLNANDYVDFRLRNTSIYSFGGGHSICYVQLVQ